jgi:hypothetical protein
VVSVRINGSFSRPADFAKSMSGQKCFARGLSLPGILRLQASHQACLGRKRLYQGRGRVQFQSELTGVDGVLFGQRWATGIWP